MSRGGKTKEQELAFKLDQYKEYKDSESKLHKVSEDLNKHIKYLMNTMGIRKFSSDKWTAIISTTQKEILNEAKAIGILKENLSETDFKSVVKTREYIDDDALETLVYNGDFDITKLESCKVVGKEVTTLRVSKIK
jgi:hypothetical protein|nr:MAG TPA: hypothetical protein [Caudoviricetes sp.]